MQKRMTRKLSQLTMNYRGLGLSLHQEAGLRARTRVRAGDRVPDVIFQDARTGVETSLFALLAHNRLIALVGSGPDASSTSGHVARIERVVGALGRLGVECHVLLPKGTRHAHDDALIDATGEFRRLYGARGEFLYLVRPDGYVGLFQRPIDERALQRYVAKLFKPEIVASAFAKQVSVLPVDARR